MRGQGRVFKRPGSRYWWMSYSIGGKEHRESCETREREDALEQLRKRIGDGKRGIVPTAVKVHDLRELVETQYDLDGNRSKVRVQLAWSHVEDFFGAETRAKDVTSLRLDDYAAARLNDGAARSTVNGELAALRRGFRLALRKGLLAVMPVFTLPDPENARQGFVTEGGVAALLTDAKLPPVLRQLIQFLFSTGWRVSEATGLTWANVDRESETLHLSAAETKGKAARVFPYGGADGLKALIEARYDVRDGLFVFHRHGKQIRNFRRAWAGACQRAGLKGQLVHDLRRSAAREFRRSGLSESDVMQLAGWETPAMFRRYAIRDEAHLEAQVAKRFSRSRTEDGQREGASSGAGDVSCCEASTTR